MSYRPACNMQVFMCHNNLTIYLGFYRILLNIFIRAVLIDKVNSNLNTRRRVIQYWMFAAVHHFYNCEKSTVNVLQNQSFIRAKIISFNSVHLSYISSNLATFKIDFLCATCIISQSLITSEI